MMTAMAVEMADLVAESCQGKGGGNVTVTLRFSPLGASTPCGWWGGGEALVVGRATKARRQATLLYLPRLMARMVWGVVVLAVVVIV
jgi:hypothetical protein